MVTLLTIKNTQKLLKVSQRLKNVRNSHSDPRRSTFHPVGST